MKQLGVIVPIVTPCTRSGQVDVEGLKTVCDDMMSAGCHGVFVAGSTGRGPWFSWVDRMEICCMIGLILKLPAAWPTNWKSITLRFMEA